MDRVALYRGKIKGKTKMKTDMISIVIPFYKVKKIYMEECIESIKKQTFKNWEVIVIDDGSEEDIARWLDSYSTPLIRVIHQKNAGVSAARNRGIQEAAGEWIYFCDPDDIMMKNELEELYSIAQETESDIVVCGHKKIDINGNSVAEIAEDRKEVICVTNMEDMLFELVAPGVMNWTYDAVFQDYSLRFPWAHLYKKECIKNLKFPIGLHPGEDKIFNMLACKNVNKLALTNAKLHMYRIAYGVTGRYSANSLENSRCVKQLAQEIITSDKSNRTYRCAIAKMEADEMAYLMKHFFFHRDNPMNKWNRIQQFKNYLKEDMTYYPKYVDFENLTKKQRIIFLAYRIKVIYLIGLFMNY